MIQSTYSMYLSINENGDLEAKSLEETGRSATHFEKITKALYDEGRFLDETIDYTELLPDTEYNIWGKDETSKKVNDLVKMFAQFSRLPKLLNPRVIHNALKQGIEEGGFIAQIERPDKTEKTYWKVAPTLDEFEKNKDIKVAPIDRAVVHTISSETLYKIFKELKTPSHDIVTTEEIKTYFSREDSPKF